MIANSSTQKALDNRFLIKIDGRSRSVRAYIVRAYIVRAYMKIEELESQVEEGLSKLRSPEFQSLDLDPLVPKGYRVHVSLTDKKGRKKRRDASADNWSPESGEIRISFEPETKSVVAFGEAIKQESTPTSDPVSDLVRALDRAESRPGYQF